MDYNDRYFFEPELDENTYYARPLPQPRPKFISEPQIMKEKKKKLDDEKLFLYFIIILLICAIVIITNNFNAQIFELSKKQVKVI
jgi:hypothetical protein